MKNINSNKLLKTVLTLLLCYTLQAGAEITTSDTSRHLPYLVGKNKSKLINLDRKITQITVGNPAVADFTLMSPNQLLIRGISEGRTNATLWDSNKHVAMVVDVEVVEEQVQSQNIRELKKLLHEVLPDEHIQVLRSRFVYPSQRRGFQTGFYGLCHENRARFCIPTRKRWLRISYAPGSDASVEGPQINVSSGLGSSGVAGSNGGGGCGDRTQGSAGGGGNTSQSIINMMHVGGEQQVMLQVKVAEVSRTLARALSLNARASNFQAADGSYGHLLRKWLISLVSACRRRRGVYRLLCGRRYPV